MTRALKQAVANIPLRRLRGLPLLSGLNPEQLTAELLAPLSGQPQLSPTPEELSVLRRELDVEGLTTRLLAQPELHLRQLLDWCAPHHDNHLDTHAALLLAISGLSAQQLHDPELQLTLEQSEEAWHFWSDDGGPDMGVACAYLLRLHQVSPRAAQMVTGRLASGLDATPAPEIMSTLRPEGGHDPRARQLARSLMGAPHDHAARDALSREVSPDLRAALAAASWRSGTYDRSRHPRPSLDSALTHCRTETQAEGLRRACAGKGPERLAALTVLSRMAGTRPTGTVGRSGSVDRRLIGPGPTLLWEPEQNLPVLKSGETRSDHEHNLAVAYASHALVGDLTPEEETQVLTLCATLGPHAMMPGFISLPPGNECLTLLRAHDPSLTREADQAALSVLCRETWVPVDDLQAARKLLSEPHPAVEQKTGSVR